jgi:hypothetical protein
MFMSTQVTYMKEKQKRMKGKGEEDGHGNWAAEFTSLLLGCVSISREKKRFSFCPVCPL